VAAVREALPAGIALMVDANQQWDRATAARVCADLDGLGLHWIEEPLDAYDVQGHADLRSRLLTPVASGEMLTSAAEHRLLLDGRAVDVAQPDAARVGGITPFLEVAAQAARDHLWLAPHFAMELHVHLSATHPGPAWVEHFDWFQPLFEEAMVPVDGCMPVPDGPGLGLTLSARARELTVEEVTVTSRGW
jgi:L-talarate/galactarate dehydratase